MPHQCTNCGRAFADGSKEMLSGCPDCGGNKFQFQPKAATSSPDESADSSPDEPDGTGTTGTGDSPAETDPTPSPSETADRAWPGTDSGRSTPDAGSSSSGAPSSTSQPSPSTTETAGTERPTAETSPADDTHPTDTDTGTGTDTDTDTNTDVHTDADVDTESPQPPRTSDEDHAQASARSDMVTPDELADAAVRSRKPPDDVDGQVIEPQTDDRPGLDELREELNSQFESIKIVSPGQYELNLMELYDRQEYIISLQEDGRYVIEVPDSWGDRPDDE
jgi:predicted  nucleic acid-binding Zn-ribbon protein